MLKYRIDIKYVIYKNLGVNHKELSEEDKNNILIDFTRYVRSLYVEMIAEKFSDRYYRENWIIESKELLSKLKIDNVERLPIVLMNNISTEYAYESSSVGIDKEIMYPNSDVPLHIIVAMVEEGTSKTRSRRLVTTIINQIKNNLKTYYLGYLTMKGYIV